MAVYKPTFCFPFATGVDARVAKYKDEEENLAKFLSCKVDTSNKNVTGYKLKILTENNDVVFEGKKISPISELTELRLETDETQVALNSGINGTFLRIPFFQNLQQPLLASYNAIYYDSQYLVDRVIFGEAEAPMENPNNWVKSDIYPGEFVYEWPDTTPEEREEQRHNLIELDGELLQEGDLVLIAGASGNPSDGIWKVVKEEATDNAGLPIVTTALRIVWRISSGASATVLKGKTWHNTFWKEKNLKFVRQGAEASWRDINGNKIVKFDINNNNYKWEVTLYQGNFEIESSENPQAIKYTNLDSEWLDMTINSGRIMGSTPERIQVGMSDDKSDPLTWDIPRGTDADPLVLQNTFMALSKDPKTLGSAARVPVKSYDATFGHAYLTKDALLGDISDYNYCAFFKYANDPNYIKDTDMVDWAFTDRLNLGYYELQSNGKAGNELENAWSDDYSTSPDKEIAWMGVSSLQRYVCVKGSLPDNIQDGQYILLTKQHGNNNRAKAKENGVYLVSTMVASNGAKRVLYRAPGYETWASYIGKVFYSCGDGKNYECQASGGVYTLWNPYKVNSETGNSPIYFSEETPLILQWDKISERFDLYSADNSNQSDSYTYTGIQIDGEYVRSGDRVLFRDGYYYSVTAVNSSKSQCTLTRQGRVAKNSYFYILRGDSSYHKIYKSDSNRKIINSVDTTLLHGNVLKNTKEYTYISPWITLEKTMKLKLLNGARAVFSGGFVETEWVNILGFNNKTFCISHDKLEEAFVSFDPEDDNIPYRYDIKTYFKSSDENIFYSYETPYVILYKNNEPYTDLGVLGGSQVYSTIDIIGETWEQFNVRVGQSAQDRESFLVPFYTSQQSIAGRAVKLSATYRQFGQSSWESYRWILLGRNVEDGEGEYTKVLQDTGRRYDKNITATFYGLANDTEEKIPYKFVLQIENEIGDTFEYSVILYSLEGTRAPALQEDAGEFSVHFDCSTQSNIIVIRYEPIKYGQSDDSTYSIYRREYEIYPRIGTRVEGKYYTTARGGNFFIRDDGLTTFNTAEIYLDTNTGLGYQYDPNHVLDPFYPVDMAKFAIGEWEPVLIHENAETQVFRDFNITSGRSYQYIVYPGVYDATIFDQSNAFQTYANYQGAVWVPSVYNDTDTVQGYISMGSFSTSSKTGAAVATSWGSWSICELIPEELDVDVPTVRKKYRVNNQNIWLLKYGLDTGSQTQNISREEFTTLGKYPKFGFGALNAASGSITAFLGNELVPASKTKYVERLAYSRVDPLSTNERAEMLKMWQSFVYSSNPKLLRDIKGQAWIVQLTGSSSTPQNFVSGVPDTISFEWKQVDSTDKVIIYGNYDLLAQEVRNSYGTIQQKGFFASLPKSKDCSKFDYAQLVEKNYVSIMGLGSYWPSRQVIIRSFDFPDSFPEVRDAYGNIFIKIPTIYRKILQVKNGQITAFKISTKKLSEDYYPYSVFLYENEDRETEILPYVLIGKYGGGNFKDNGALLTSSSSVDGDEKIQARGLIDFARLAAQGFGPGYQQYDWQFQKLLTDLILAIKKQVNFQNGGKTIFESLGVSDLDLRYWIDGVNVITEGSRNGNEVTVSSQKWQVCDSPENYDKADSYNEAYDTPTPLSVPTLITDKYATIANGVTSVLGYQTSVNGRLDFFNYPTSLAAEESYITYYCDNFQSQLWFNSMTGEQDFNQVHYVTSCIGAKDKKNGLWNTRASVAGISGANISCSRLCYRPISEPVEKSREPEINWIITETDAGGHPDGHNLEGIEITNAVKGAVYFVMARTDDPRWENDNEGRGNDYQFYEIAQQDGTFTIDMTNHPLPHENTLYDISVVAQEPGLRNSVSVGCSGIARTEWEYPTKYDGPENTGLSVTQVFEAEQENTDLTIQ